MILLMRDGNAPAAFVRHRSHRPARDGSPFGGARSERRLGSFVGRKPAQQQGPEHFFNLFRGQLIVSVRRELPGNACFVIPGFKFDPNSGRETIGILLAESFAE